MSGTSGRIQTGRTQPERRKLTLERLGNAILMLSAHARHGRRDAPTCSEIAYPCQAKAWGHAW